MIKEIVNNWDLITNNNMNILILFGLIFAGIFIKLFLAGHSSNTTGQASSTIWGYGLTTISLFTLMFIVLSNDLNKDTSPLSLIYTTGLPIFSLIVILIYIISINLSYFRIINKNFVPNEYSTYSTISSILIIFQIMIIFQFSKILLNKSKNSEYLSKIINVTWIFSILNFLLAVIMNIIVKFFTTDG
jgi:hypothetical protein|tara:strand:+ start:788 stop:1351 length:564 start_codon:yes stop_codon:yes gene_type:complete